MHLNHEGAKKFTSNKELCVELVSIKPGAIAQTLILNIYNQRVVLKLKEKFINILNYLIKVLKVRREIRKLLFMLIKLYKLD